MFIRSFFLETSKLSPGQNSKKGVGRTINTFGSNKKLHTVMKVLNYGFIG